MKYFLILLFLMTTQAEAAKVRVFAEKNSIISISLSGQIRVGDENKLKQIIKKRNPRQRPKYALYLNSNGGQIRAAFKIGYMVRQLGIITVIDKNRSCLSACSLIFIAGWDEANHVPHRIKHPRGKLGVHHPYVKLKHGRKRKSSKKTMVFTKEYFDRMHAGAPLYEQMARTHYRKMSYVKNKTLRRLTGYHIGNRPHRWPLKRLASDYSGERYNEEFWRNTNREDVLLPVERPSYTNTGVIRK